MTTDKQDPSRAAFEVNMVNACGAEVIDLARLDGGEYKWRSVREMWSIWQASRKQALASAEDRVTTLYEAQEPPYLADICNAIKDLK